MATITLDRVGKTYPGGVAAVQDISVAIADGEFLVLVGPSGCGKSTLLRMLAGLETITDGTVKIGDRVVNMVEPADRDIAMVFQNYALYPHMTVRDNLAYGLKNRGTPKAEIARRVAEAAKILEIGAYLDRKPRALSGGQRQRVAVPLCANRRRFCLMNRYPIWTPSCVSPCAARFASCSAGLAPHRSTSPMTRWRR
jgi:sn-glycerol 3-phosphate transport system ATP-binding protein